MQVWTTRDVLEAARHDTAQVIKALNGLFSSLPGAKILNSPGAVTIKQRVQGGQFLMKLEHDHLKLWYEAGDPLSGLSGADLQDIGVVPGMVGQVRRLTSVEGLEDLELPQWVPEQLDELVSDDAQTRVASVGVLLEELSQDTRVRRTGSDPRPGSQVVIVVELQVDDLCSEIVLGDHEPQDPLRWRRVPGLADLGRVAGQAFQGQLQLVGRHRSEP